MARLGTLMRGGNEDAELKGRLEAIGVQNERLERELRTELARSRAETSQNAKIAREELTGNLSHFAQTLQNQLASSASLQNDRLSTLTQSNEQRLEAVRATVEQRLELLRTDNAQKLEQMRTTVDEKLHATLEQRLGQSVKLVSDRREVSAGGSARLAGRAGSKRGRGGGTVAEGARGSRKGAGKGHPPEVRRDAAYHRLRIVVSPRVKCLRRGAGAGRRCRPAPT